MKIEGIGFKEAVEQLAEKANIQLPTIENAEDTAREELKAKIYKINQFTAEYYHQNLYKPTAKMAQEYVKKRKLTQSTLETYKIGFSGRFDELCMYNKEFMNLCWRVYTETKTDYEEFIRYEALGGKNVRNSGYIKMDYNIEPGIGTELNADSAGDGLLGHNRAYLKWLDGIFVKYPNLVIENCSSGGLRMDYAMLSRYSIQSTSDQEDYIRYATIAANSPMALTPEQAAIWSYPLTEGDKEEVIFNMVNAILLRIHQSGHLVNLSPERFDLVKEAISYYKTIRVDIKNAVPFWPLGLSKYRDPWVSMGLNAGKKDYVAVWRRNSQTAFATIPVEHRKGQDLKVVCGYPKAEPCNYKWNKEAGELTVEFPNPVSARLFCLEEV